MRAKPMKHHDLNSAILYTVQLGFSLFSFVFCLTSVADLVEPIIGFLLRAFQGNATPSSGRDSVGCKLVGSGQYSKRFFVPAPLLSVLQCYASYLLHSVLCNEGARHTV
jgi:hypothetical protein